MSWACFRIKLAPPTSASVALEKLMALGAQDRPGGLIDVPQAFGGIARARASHPPTFVFTVAKFVIRFVRSRASGWVCIKR